MNKYIYSLFLAICLSAGVCHAKDKRMHIHRDHTTGISILSGLRAARWMLDYRPGDWVQTRDIIVAEKEIDDAIYEINEAAIDDGEGTDAHLPVDDRADTLGRMREAIGFLTTAHGQLIHDKAGKLTKSLRSSTLKHIDLSKAALDRAIAAAEKAAKLQIKTVHPTPHISDYPAYAHALYNLRAARWMLVHKPGNYKQAPEEPEAVKQIEAAIHEITRVGINDGKAMEDDPPADEYPDHISHLKTAYSFLKKAREDVAHGEEDRHTNLLRGPSYKYIDEAVRNVIIAEHTFSADKPLLVPVHRWACPLPTILDGLIYYYP